MGAGHPTQIVRCSTRASRGLQLLGCRQRGKDAAQNPIQYYTVSGDKIDVRCASGIADG